MSSACNTDPQNQAQAPGRLSRRGFLRLGVGALGALALVEAGGVGFVFLRARSLEGEYGGLVTAGAIDDFQPGSVTEFEHERFFLIRAPDGGFEVRARLPWT